MQIHDYKMKLHDRLPDAETLRSYRDLYKPIGIGSFFLNTQNILTTNRIITTGHTYLLFEYVLGKIIKASPVVLKRVVVTGDEVYVIVIDMLTDEVHARKLTLGKTAKRNWKLVALDVINANNLDIIESQSNSKTRCDDELLEFCF